MAAVRLFRLYKIVAVEDLFQVVLLLLKLQKSRYMPSLCALYVRHRLALQGSTNMMSNTEEVMLLLLMVRMDVKVMLQGIKSTGMFSFKCLVFSFLAILHFYALLPFEDA
jgi:hypothetical protein